MDSNKDGIVNFTEFKEYCVNVSIGVVDISIYLQLHCKDYRLCFYLRNPSFFRMRGYVEILASLIRVFKLGAVQDIQTKFETFASVY